MVPGEQTPGLGCSTLAEIEALIGDCRRCRLSETRTRIVFGSGDPVAKVMLIGEAPGKNEDLTGVPFVGAAGKFLDELLAAARLARDDVFVANVVKCRPPGNRNPAPAEIETCIPFLREQIKIVDPEIIVTLGNFATRVVLRTDAGITTLRGTVHQAGRFKVLPVYHPAAAIYDRSKREPLLADFRLLGELIS